MYNACLLRYLLEYWKGMACANNGPFLTGILIVVHQDLHLVQQLNVKHALQESYFLSALLDVKTLANCCHIVYKGRNAWDCLHGSSWCYYIMVSAGVLMKTRMLLETAYIVLFRCQTNCGYLPSPISIFITLISVNWI